MSLKDEMRKTAHAVGKSHKTRDARIKHVTRFADYLRAKNIQIKQIEHIKRKHIKEYVADRLEAGISKRSIQNEMANIRRVLRHVGRDKLVDLPELSNKSLGLAGASRLGNKTAISDERVGELVKNIKDPGVAAAANLERALGLRGEEGVKSFKSLKTWEIALVKNQPIRVIYGTKGKKPRDVRPHERVRALAAVKAAIKVAAEFGGKLIDKPNEKSAMGRYTREMRKAGFIGKESGHALRYSFTRAQFHGYLAKGFTRDEALALTSLDLGHGDGRGRWVERVYLR